MSTWYPLFLSALWQQSVNTNLSSGAVKYALLTSAYTYNASHQFLSNLTGVIGTAVTLSAKQFINGSLTATVPNYSGAELDTNTVTQAVLYIDTGVAGTSRLVAHEDGAAVFPLLGTGPDVAINLGAMPLCTTVGSKIIYPLFAQALFEQPVNSDVAGGTFKVGIVDLDDYTYNAAHQFLSDIPAGARVGTPQTVGNKTFTNGVFNSTDGKVTFPALSGDQSEAWYGYIDTSVEATSRLVTLNSSAQGLPLTPNGQNQDLVWGATGIAVLGAAA